MEKIYRGLILLALVVAIWGLYLPVIPEVEVVNLRGTTNYDSLALSSNLTVTGETNLVGLIQGGGVLTLADNAAVTVTAAAWRNRS